MYKQKEEMATYINTLTKIREEKEIISQETNRIISIIRNKMHKMQTPGIHCYCDRCQDLSSLIITILKEKR